MNSVRKYDDLNDEERMHFWRAYDTLDPLICSLFGEMRERRDVCEKAIAARGSVGYLAKIRDWNDFCDETLLLQEEVYRRIEMIKSAFDAFNGVIDDEDDCVAGGSDGANN